MRVTAAWAFLAIGALVCSGCEGCESREPETATPRARLEGRGRTGVIEGSVRLAEGAELPMWALNPVVAPQGRPDVPAACSPPQESDRQPVKLVGERRLSGVMVALSMFETEPPHEPVTHELVIRDCRLTPPIVVATRGDRLRIVNETDYPFMPDLRMGMLQAILFHGQREVELAQGGMHSLRCEFAASCGRAEVFTLYHPLHAVTDEQGRFRIEDVPANDELRVNAWHPLFREVHETVTLEPGETRTIELVLEPGPPEEVPPPVERPPGRAEDNPTILF